MPTLYVTEAGSRLEKEYKRLVVSSRQDEVLAAVPILQVSDVVITGTAGVTTQAMLSLLDAGISLSIISSTGALRGRLSAPTTRNLFLRRQQYASSAQAEFCLAISRAVTRGKLHNQLVYARRYIRRSKGSETGIICKMQKLIGKITLSNSIDRLRGLEGTAGRMYFRAFRAALPKTWDFDRRSRRPPADPVNALLSFGYSLLTQNMMTALEIAGLDPYDGLMHTDVYGRPALALDLMEEFRPLIVDSVVMTLINKRMLRSQDFQKNSEGGWEMQPKALKTFVTQYKARLQTGIMYPPAGRKLTYQKIFEAQAWHLRRVIEGSQKEYIPFQVK